MNESVKNILEGSQYMTLATVSEDGSPRNVPIRFAYDEEYFYFRSPTGTVHGSNIERDGRVAAVIIDTSQSTKGAVYLHSFAKRLGGADEVKAVKTFNSRFDNPPDQWDETVYYRFGIGELDESRSVAKMYYFQGSYTA